MECISLVSFFFLTKCGENLVFDGWVAPEDVTHHVSVLRLE